MPRPRRRPKPDRRRALELLASCRGGCSEAIMLAHGFSIDMMVELVNAGLATATAERVVAGGKKLEVARVRITEAGRRALEGTRREESKPWRRDWAMFSIGSAVGLRPYLRCCWL
jgi:tryptophan synthase beta subunit